MTCEKCWSDAYGAMVAEPHKSQAECYEEIYDRRTLFGHICTPQEQAGQWWDEEKQCDSRNIVDIPPPAREQSEDDWHEEWHRDNPGRESECRFCSSGADKKHGRRKID